MADIPLLDLQPPPLTPPNILYIHEDPEEAYRVAEATFATSVDCTLEQSIRQLCDRLKIPPLSSYLMASCQFPNPSEDTRRWLPLGDRPYRTSELRLCVRHFTPKQLAYLSEALLKYHFLTVKFDLLRSRRIKLNTTDPKHLNQLISKLLIYDICRILCQARDDGSISSVLASRDLITSLTKKYDVLFDAPNRLRWLKNLPQFLFWKRAPKLMYTKLSPVLKSKIQGRQWTDFVIAYLDTIEQAYPGLRSNRHELHHRDRFIELGSNGLAFPRMGDRILKCDVASLDSAHFMTQQIMELWINPTQKGDFAAGPFRREQLAFETELDARSFAVELSLYCRALQYAGRSILTEEMDSGISIPSQTFHAAYRCWGPLSVESDLDALYQASNLLASKSECNAIAFESSKGYDIVGVLVTHDRPVRRESVRWYWKRQRNPQTIVFQDVQTMSYYTSLERAAADQLVRLTHLSAEADQMVPPKMYFDETAVLPPFQVLIGDQGEHEIQTRITRDHQVHIHGTFNTVELATLEDRRIALKYVANPSSAATDALNQSQQFAERLKPWLTQSRDGAREVFREFIASVDRAQPTFPRCLVLEYLDETLARCLSDNGMRYSLRHILQACLDAVSAAYFLWKFGFAHGEMSCKKLFVCEKPSGNGHAALRVKLAEPSCHSTPSDHRAGAGAGGGPPAMLLLGTDPYERDREALGWTLKEIFHLSTLTPQRRASTRDLTTINFDTFYENRHRYNPWLPRDQFRVIGDNVQRVLLSLSGPPARRMALDQIRQEFSTMLCELNMIPFRAPNYEYDRLFDDRRILRCDPGDLRIKIEDPNEESRPLGSGHFGTVWKVERCRSDGAEPGEIFALKILRSCENSDRSIRAATIQANQLMHLGQLPPGADRSLLLRITADLKEELTMQLDLNHPNVARLRGILCDRHGLITGILMNFHPNGSLANYLKIAARNLAPATDRQKLKWAGEIAAGMAYLHLKNIVHRDLAARNVLLGDQLEALVADFGLATAEPCIPYESYPTEYWPPEWRGLTPRLINRERVVFETPGDVYAFGILLWELDNDGRPPRFRVPLVDDGSSALLILNVNGSERLHRLICMCALRAPASDRPSFEQMISEGYFSEERE